MTHGATSYQTGEYKMPTREPEMSGQAQATTPRTSSKESLTTSTSQDMNFLWEDLVSAAIRPGMRLSELQAVVIAGQRSGVQMREPYEEARQAAIRTRGLNPPPWEEVVQ